MHATGARLIRGDPMQVVTGVVSDSRLAIPGSLFVGLPGEHVDGGKYAQEAVRAGAVAVLVSEESSRQQRLGAELASRGVGILAHEQPLTALRRLAEFHRAAWNGTVVGITGSVGKTTTRDLLSSVLAQRYRVLRPQENYNTEVGVALTLLRLTPRHEVAVLELAMRARGEIASLTSVARPEIGLLTRIAPAHLEYLGSIENIARTKGELVEGLPPNGHAVLSYDDPYQRPMSQRTQASTLWYGFDSHADITAEDIRPYGTGMRFTIRTPWEIIRDISLPLLGRHHVSDALGAVAAAKLLGISSGDVVAGLSHTERSAHRSHVVRTDSYLILDDTYNASPASVEAALASLAQLATDAASSEAPDGTEATTTNGAQWRRVAILGDMLELGEESPRFHRQVGEEVTQSGVDLLIAVGPNSRAIAEGVRHSGLPQVHHFLNLDDFLKNGLSLLRCGDVILVKGSRAMGMEKLVERLTDRVSKTEQAGAVNDENSPAHGGSDV